MAEAPVVIFLPDGEKVYPQDGTEWWPRNAKPGLRIRCTLHLGVTVVVDHVCLQVYDAGDGIECQAVHIITKET